MVKSRFGLLGVDAGLACRLVGAATTSMQVESCQDPVRFAADSVDDRRHQRVLGVSLDVAGIWEVLEKLHPWAETCPLLAVHNGGDIRGQLRAIAHGVTVVVSRDAAPARIIRAAEAALDGDAVVERSAFAAFAAVLPARDATTESLSTEERNWLAWLADGMTMQALARSAGWSERQMRRRLSGLYLRLGVVNRDQAVALASRLGIID